MDRGGNWSLAPTYDECYAYNPNGDWTSQHQMSVNGKRIGITDDDILTCAHFANMRERKAKSVMDEIKDAIREWPRFASGAEVNDELTDEISRRLIP